MKEIVEIKKISKGKELKDALKTLKVLTDTRFDKIK